KQEPAEEVVRWLEFRRVLFRSQTGLRAGVEIEAYGDRWIVSDVDAAMRPGRPLPPDHVLGVGGASTTLAESTIRRPVGTALDLEIGRASCRGRVSGTGWREAEQ